MFTSIVLKNVLDNLQQILFEGGYPLTVPYKYDRALDFSPNLHKDIVKMRQHRKDEDGPWWCGMMFNRDPIKPYGEYRNREAIGIRNRAAGIASTFLWASCQTLVNVRIFCSSLDTIETLEEWLCTRMFEKSYKVTYADWIPDIEVSVREIAYNGIDQLESEQFGTIGYMDISFTVVYPVMFNNENMPVILEINFDLYTLSNNVLLEEMQYREDLPTNPGKWKWFQGANVI